jgi:hypothetical protein
MKLFAIIAASLLSSVAAHGEDEAKVALSVFEALSGQADSITKASSRDEVLLVLGEPKSKGAAGWNNLDTKVWTYLNFTDDSQHLSFAVHFSPKSGCSVAASHSLRKKVKKGKLRDQIGIVRNVYPNYPPGGEGGFLCHVQFDDGSLHSVAIGRSRRVAGEPEKDAKIRIKHYGTDGHYIFVGYYSLLLESIAFSKKGEQGDADQPATAVDSKAEGKEEPKPESKGRSQ